MALGDSKNGSFSLVESMSFDPLDLKFVGMTLLVEILRYLIKATHVCWDFDLSIYMRAQRQWTLRRILSFPYTVTLLNPLLALCGFKNHSKESQLLYGLNLSIGTACLLPHAQPSLQVLTKAHSHLPCTTRPHISRHFKVLEHQRELVGSYPISSTTKVLVVDISKFISMHGRGKVDKAHAIAYIGLPQPCKLIHL